MTRNEAQSYGVFGLEVRCPICKARLVWTGDYFACAEPPELHGKLLPLDLAKQLAVKQRIKGKQEGKCRV